MSGKQCGKVPRMSYELENCKREREGAALGIEAVAVSARNRGASFSSGGVHQASPLFPAIQAFQSSVHNARTKMSNQRTRGRKKKLWNQENRTAAVIDTRPLTWLPGCRPYIPFVRCIKKRRGEKRNKKGKNKKRVYA